ncbi:response regulator transcription factor [Cohnella nanjingensis]|uniref:Response regulator n=1 Tax=Cohnella nanjingensis TaxID=1387779 RepID=A0A7X0VHD4_9BACL|nr:response regulator [Cohnella nanjingensis]MBB6672519.1 response regulator [Cohnella nanjingensis]
MIKVLVVDDEKLVRAGFIALMPWDKFGMQVVGEAGNGEQALDFLTGCETDLVITDLAMPGMSGLELMRALKGKRPDIYIVVLTFHQDFELVQEALRLGAIDYIAKVQLEKEKLESVLARIVERIQSDRAKMARRVSQPLSVAVYPEKTLVCLFSGEDGSAGILPAQLAFLSARGAEVDEGLWCLTAEDGSELPELLARCLRELGDREWVYLEPEGRETTDSRTLHKALRKFQQVGFFYERRPDQRTYRIGMDRLRLFAELREDPETFERLARLWSSSKWLKSEEAYRDNLQATQAALLAPGAVKEMFGKALQALSDLLSDPVSGSRPEGVHLRYWSDWVRELAAIRGTFAATYAKSLYSAEILESVTKAVQYISARLEDNLHLTDVAREVNVSRSYFSQCFKDLTGRPFNDYVRELRLERAKSLLASSDKPIYWIAEKSGYPDEKYFSKLFRARFGMLPSEYRADNAT